MATIDLSNDTFKDLVSIQIQLSEKYGRNVSSDEIIGILLMKLQIQLQQHGKESSESDPPQTSINNRKLACNHDPKRKGYTVGNRPGTGKGFWLVFKKRPLHICEASEN